MLLNNMAGELEAALGASSKLVTPEDLPAAFTAAQVHNALGYQQKGLDFAKSVKMGTDLSPLLVAPTVLHGKPRSLKAGTKFEVFDKPGDLTSKEQVEFTGFGKAPNGDITMGFKIRGVEIKTSMADPDAAVSAGAASGPRKATPGNIYELPCIVPGEVLQYNVKVGDVLEAGQPLVVLES